MGNLLQTSAFLCTIFWGLGIGMVFGEGSSRITGEVEW